MNQIKKSEFEFITKTRTIQQLNDTLPSEHSPFEKFWLAQMQDDIVLIAYTIMGVVLIVFTIGRSLAFYRFCNKASIRLHNNMFDKIVYATMRFFNVNTSGRILNRFSKDMNQVDEVLPLTLLDTLQVCYLCMQFIIN